MKTLRNPNLAFRVLSLAAVYVLVIAGGATSLYAQGEAGAAGGEPDTLGTFADPSFQGNTVQQARALLNTGMRDLSRSMKLEEKAAETDDPKKAAKLLEKSQAANASAIQNLMRALQQNSDMLEGYEALGHAFRREGKYQEALQVHSLGLGRNPQSMENFEGWSESVMALNMLGDATKAYSQFVEQGSPFAPVLMEDIKEWLAAHQADPGDIDPAHVEKLAEWVAEQGG